MNQIRKPDWEDKLKEKIQIELTLEELLDMKIAMGRISHHTILSTAKEQYDFSIYEELRKDSIHLDTYKSAASILNNNGIKTKDGLS